MKTPVVARVLGLSGLMPLLGLVVMLATGIWPDMRGAALALGLGYAALILSFLGGLWWGLAAAARAVTPGWVWVVAVVPSLYGWAVMGLVGFQRLEVNQGLAVIGGGLLLALVVDRALAARGLAPEWWLALRFPLSFGLGGLSLMAAALA